MSVGAGWFRRNNEPEVYGQHVCYSAASPNDDPARVVGSAGVPTGSRRDSAAIETAIGYGCGAGGVTSRPAAHSLNTLPTSLTK